MNVSKIIAAVLIVIMFTSCASQPKKIGIDDPFSDQLYFYYRKQQWGRRWFFVSTLSLAGSFAVGSYFATTRALGNTSLFNDIGYYSSYGLAAGSFGMSIYSFYLWSKYTDAYLETLRLQTQYYNIINPYD